jgi:hypothetical protein
VCPAWLPVEMSDHEPRGAFGPSDGRWGGMKKVQRSCDRWTFLEFSGRRLFGEAVTHIQLRLHVTRIPKNVVVAVTDRSQTDRIAAPGIKTSKTNAGTTQQTIIHIGELVGSQLLDLSGNGRRLGDG